MLADLRLLDVDDDTFEVKTCDETFSVDDLLDNRRLQQDTETPITHLLNLYTNDNLPKDKTTSLRYHAKMRRHSSDSERQRRRRRDNDDDDEERRYQLTIQ